MNAGIIPATSSNTGNFIVSIHSVSNRFKYQAVMKRHLDNVVCWFLEKKEYTPQELINGLKREIKYIKSADGIGYRCNHNPYPSALEMTLEIMLEEYPLVDYPEYHI